eukprot:1088362-Rhodomonas_salina.1
MTDAVGDAHNGTRPICIDNACVWDRTELEAAKVPAQVLFAHPTVSPLSFLLDPGVSVRAKPAVQRHQARSYSTKDVIET